MKIDFKKLLGVSYLLLICSCSKSGDSSLIIESQKSKMTIDKITVCENKRGFEIHFDSITNRKLKNQKVERMFLKNGENKKEIFLFNILYSPKDGLKHQSPLTPKGFIATFKGKNNYSIDILSTDKPDIIGLFDKNEISECED